MKTRSILGSLGLLGVLAIATPALAAKTLVYCSEGSPEGFNPIFYSGGTTLDASGRTIFNRLVEFRPGTTEVLPGLAEKWEIAADGLSMTFHLRKGVKFQTTKEFTPSRTVNADDVLFSFNRQMDANHPYHKVSNGTYEYWEGMSMNDAVAKVEKLDDLTVKLVLKRPEAPMLANLAMDFASISSAEYADKMMKAGTPEVFDQKPVGTGPFQLVDYQKDSVIRYKANPDYWKGKVALDNLVFAITTDPTVRYQKLKANECQVMAYPNPADVASMKSDPNLKVIQQEGLNIGFLGYNTKKPPFDKVEVRKALNMAINKAAIIEAVYLGAGRVAKNPIPPTMWGYNDKVKDDAFDPAQAKKMLEKAGIKDLTVKLWAMPVSRPYNPNARRMAEMIQEDWKKVGVNSEIVSMEWGEYLKRTKQGEQEAYLLGWTGDNGDPDNFLAVLLGCDAVGASNRSQWCYKPFDDLVTKAKSESSQAERAKLYMKAQEIFKEQAPWDTIAHSVVTEVTRSNVTGYVMQPLGLHTFDTVDLK